MSELTIAAIVARLQEADHQFEATAHTATTALTFADAARSNVGVVFRSTETETAESLQGTADAAVQSLHDAIRAANAARTHIADMLRRLLH